MAIKSAITSAINTAYTAVVNIVKAKAALNSVLDELYRAPENDDETTTNVFTKSGTNFEYEFTVWKTGRTVHFTGTFRKTTATMLTYAPIATITDSEFLPYALTRMKADDGSGTVTLLIDAAGVVRAAGSMGSSVYVFNGTYPVLN